MKLTRDSNGFRRIVMAEILIPDTLNVYGDYHTRASIEQFAYSFAESGFGIDVEHDNIDRTGSLLVVESFIARSNDSDFIEGSWVIGILVRDNDIWNGVLSGEINGFSYEALVKFVDIIIDVPVDKVISGVTEPDIYDGHTHKYTVILDDDGRVISGGTDVVNTHDHNISVHTSTDLAQSHRHIFNVLSGESVEEA